MITIKLMDSEKDAGHAVAALFFGSFRGAFYRKKKNQGKGKKRKKGNIVREHGYVRANNFVAEFALVQ